MGTGNILMNYYRLMAGSYSTVNLAIHQSGYDFVNGQEKFTNAKLVRDFIDEIAWRKN